MLTSFISRYQIPRKGTGWAYLAGGSGPEPVNRGQGDGGQAAVTAHLWIDQEEAIPKEIPNENRIKTIMFEELDEAMQINFPFYTLKCQTTVQLYCYLGTSIVERPNIHT